MQNKTLFGKQMSVVSYNFLPIVVNVIQGVPFAKLQKEKAVAQNWCIFDPMLVKPKWV